MKKLLLAACLLFACWIVYPLPASAVMEEIALPAGSNQLGPLDGEESTSKQNPPPAQNSNAVNKTAAEPAKQAAKPSQKKEKKSLTKKNNQQAQKKAVKKQTKKAVKKQAKSQK